MSLYLPLLSGLLLAFSFPPVPSSLLPFGALLPFAVFLAGLPSGAAGRLSATRGGYALGVLLFAVLLHWIPFALAQRAPLGVASYLVVVAILAAFPGLAAAVAHQGLHVHRLPLWVALPVAWTGAEWLRAHLPWGLAFPWMGTAAALAGVPDALFLAEALGERGVTFWIVLVNALAAEGLVRARGAWVPRGPVRPWVKDERSSRLRPLVAALVVLVLPWAWGSVRGGGLGPGPTLTVAAVHTDFSRTGREDPGEAAREMASALPRLLGSLQPSSAALVILPETAFPVPLDGQGGRPWRELLAGEAARLGADFLVGGLGLTDGERGGDGRVHNSAFLIDEGGIRARYDKRHLVPGVERTPIVPSPFLQALGDTVSYAPGKALPLPEVDGIRLGALICYESAFGELARAQLSGGAQLLVNLTNDGWFGALGTGARAQHQAHLVLRAIEGRVTVVRAANRGTSLVVDPSGRITRLDAAGREGVSVIAVPAAGEPTLFVRLGDVTGKLAALLSLLLLMPRVASVRLGRIPASTPPDVYGSATH